MKNDFTFNEHIKASLWLMTFRQRRRWNWRLQGKSLKQIAEIEEVSYQAVQDSLRRGLKRLNSEKINMQKVF